MFGREQGSDLIFSSLSPILKMAFSDASVVYIAVPCTNEHMEKKTPSLYLLHMYGILVRRRYKIKRFEVSEKYHQKVYFVLIVICFFPLAHISSCPSGNDLFSC